MRWLIIVATVIVLAFTSGCALNRIRNRANEIAIEDSNNAAFSYLEDLINDGQITREEADAIKRRVQERFAPEHIEAQ